MPWKQRLDYAQSLAPCDEQGHTARCDFLTGRKLYLFLDLLEAVVERFGIRIHAYVLMGNHYHLLVESVRGNLSDAMKMISIYPVLEPLAQV